MNSVAEDVKDMLVDDDDLDFTFGTNLFMGKEPLKPNECTTIFEVMGYAPQLTYNSAEKYEYPSVQIRVRANNYTEGFALIESIKESLHGRAGETWGGTYYSLIHCMNGPAMLDFDKNGRVRFIINLNLQRR